MTTKYGTDIFQTIKYYTEKKGMNVEQAIQEMESIIRCPLPENLKDMIRREN